MPIGSQGSKVTFPSTSFISMPYVSRNALLQYVPGYLKAYEAPILVRPVAPCCHLEHVEAELCPDVRYRIIPIRDIAPEFPPQFGIQHRHCAIGGQAVPFRIGGIVLQRAEHKRVFVEILRVADQLHDEVAAADVMREITEKVAAERIIPRS